MSTKVPKQLTKEVLFLSKCCKTVTTLDIPAMRLKKNQSKVLQPNNGAKVKQIVTQTPENILSTLSFRKKSSHTQGKKNFSNRVASSHSLCSIHNSQNERKLKWSGERDPFPKRGILPLLLKGGVDDAS